MTDTAEVTTEGSNDRSFKIKAGVFLTTVAGVSVLAGFSRTIMTAKRKDPAVFETAKAGNVALLEGGSKLAFRALGWGTLYSVVGVGAFCYGCWKLSGASNMDEFKMKVKGTFPQVPRNDPPKSRTDFDGLTDLLKYLSTWGRE
ncbi:transmembrane protein 242 [Phlebotomus papatasi]|uniref:Transmembrane protein 242 n=1 Tax=Phlebotomus papatasi TaxID=29031 RepID=A0A1B0DFD7_PHLPP|nr:transmembrane protein 242 [Phlebotomus papatasi]